MIAYENSMTLSDLDAYFLFITKKNFSNGHAMGNLGIFTRNYFAEFVNYPSYDNLQHLELVLTC